MKIFHLAVIVGLLSLAACSSETASSTPATSGSAVTNDDGTQSSASANEAKTPAPSAQKTPAVADGTATPPGDTPATGTDDGATPPAEDAVGDCLGKLEGGGSFESKGGTRQDCLDECNLNQANNPTTTITCTYDGAPLTLTPVGDCLGKLEGGGSFESKGGSRQDCIDECSTNQKNNPTITISCSYDGAPLAF